jgi:hypothetical protein
MAQLVHIILEVREGLILDQEEGVVEHQQIVPHQLAGQAL